MDILKDSITRPEKILERFRVDIKPIKRVTEVYPMFISRYHFNLIEEVDDPIWKQCVPVF